MRAMADEMGFTGGHEQLEGLETPTRGWPDSAARLKLGYGSCSKRGPEIARSLFSASRRARPNIACDLAIYR